MCEMVKTVDKCLVGGYSLPPYQTVCETFPTERASTPRDTAMVGEGGQGPPPHLPSEDPHPTMWHEL